MASPRRKRSVGRWEAATCQIIESYIAVALYRVGEISRKSPKKLKTPWRRAPCLSSGLLVIMASTTRFCCQGLCK
jgi:hypothetical protein